MKENDFILMDDVNSLSPTQKQQLLTVFKFIGEKPSYSVARYLRGYCSYVLSAEALVIIEPNTVIYSYGIDPNWNHITKSELENLLALINFEDNSA